MRRGEIWTVSGGKDYAGKPRPAVILQDDRFDKTASVTVCAFTTDPTDAPLFRLPIHPSAADPPTSGSSRTRSRRPRQAGERKLSRTGVRDLFFRLATSSSATTVNAGIASRLMIDKITTVPKTKIGKLVGYLADEDIVRLNRAVLVFLGIAAPPAKK